MPLPDKTPLPYVYQEFPKWKFHPDKAALIVPDADAEKALGADWFDTQREANEAMNKVRQAVLKRPNE